MKQNSWLLGILLFLSPLQMSAQKQDTVAVRETRIPVLIERQDNELFNLFQYNVVAFINVVAGSKPQKLCLVQFAILMVLDFFHDGRRNAKLGIPH